MTKDENRIINSDHQQGEGMSEAEIDNTLMESFPASDPPSWTLGTDHQEETQSGKDKSTGGSEAE